MTTKSKVRTAGNVRLRLRQVVRPLTNEMAERVLQCYLEMSELGQDEFEALVASVCNQFVRAPFGEVQALELIGALLVRGYLRSWESSKLGLLRDVTG